MHKIDFSKIAGSYDSYAFAQKEAGERLFSLLNIANNEDVLDLGCGAGNFTKKIRGVTKGKVVGVDASSEMVKTAKSNNKESDLIFEMKKAGELDYENSFDVIFCNSVFQWFKNPKPVLINSYKVLRKNGRIGIQAPATNIYCSNFIQAVEEVKNDPRMKEKFACFINPWFFLETADEYKLLFEQFGFRVTFSEIDVTKTLYTVNAIFKIFQSGAACGYLNHDFYDTSIDEIYVENFYKIIKNVFNSQVNKDGFVELIFKRIYLVADKL